MKIRLEKLALIDFKPRRGFEVKNYVDKWFSNSNILPKFKEEQKKVISRLLFTFVAHKLQKYLNSSNTFSYLLHNYHVTGLENIY